MDLWLVVEVLWLLYLAASSWIQVRSESKRSSVHLWDGMMSEYHSVVMERQVSLCLGSLAHHGITTAANYDPGLFTKGFRSMNVLVANGHHDLPQISH